MSSARRLVTPGSSGARDRSPPRSQAPPVRSPSSGARRGMVPGRTARGWRALQAERHRSGVVARTPGVYEPVSCYACDHHGRGHPASLRRAHLPGATHAGSRAAHRPRAHFVLGALSHQTSHRARCPIVGGPPAPRKAGLHEGGSCQACSSSTGGSHDEAASYVAGRAGAGAIEPRQAWLRSATDLLCAGTSSPSRRTGARRRPDADDRESRQLVVASFLDDQRDAPRLGRDSAWGRRRVHRAWCVREMRVSRPAGAGTGPERPHPESACSGAAGGSIPYSSSRLRNTTMSRPSPS